MTSALRAFLCACMLAGFYLVGLIELIIVILLIALISSVTHPVVGKLFIGVIGSAFAAMAIAAWRAMRARPELPQGLPVSRHEAPALWATVEDLAREAGTRVPDEIMLIPGVNAAVTEKARLLGLIGGRRYLFIGLPLLQAMRVDQLRSVIAHELGHYSGRHTRLGGVAYRGRLAIGGTVSGIGPANPIGWGFKAYAGLYLLIDNSLSRRMEREADRTAVRVAGRSAAAGALRDVPVLDAAWDFFFDSYVSTGWEYGFAPDDLFGGYAQLVAGRQEELDALRQEAPPSERSKWDTHPPIAERIQAIMSGPESADAADGRPAGVLLPDLTAVSKAMQRLVVDVGDRTVLPWPEFIHATFTAQMQRSADKLLRRIARVTGDQEQGLSGVLAAIEAGRAADLAEPFFPEATRRELGAKLAEPLGTLLALAAVKSGAARWKLSWSGPAELLGPNGEPLPLGEIARLAVTPGGLEEALRRLNDLGVDPGSATLAERSDSAIGARYLAGIANCKVDGVPHDLVVLSNGLVLMADPGKADKGKQRLQAVVSAGPAAELAAQHRFLPYEDVVAARLVKETPVRAEFVLHNGQTVDIREGWISEMISGDCREVFTKVVGELQARGQVLPSS